MYIQYMKIPQKFFAGDKRRGLLKKSMKNKFLTHSENLQYSLRYRINPIRNLTPQTLTRVLDNFHQGHLAPAALTWDAIERRDDILQGIISKRKKAVARLKWEIITLDHSHEAQQHKEALLYFYNNLTATHACDANQTGGLSLLIKQMLDAIAKKYSAHEVIYQSNSQNQITASFRFVPLWFFENTTGKLRLLKSINSTDSIPLNPKNWLITIGDGLMESSSIAYLFKHLPLRDWLIYCERNGMPGVKGITDAKPGTPQWDSALEAVRDFGAEFHALMTRGTDILPIDLTSRGHLPYPQLIERMDRAMISLWRGCDLSTLAKSQASGVSIQENEISIIEEDDAALISETLNSQIDRQIIKHLFNIDRGKAYIQIQPSKTHQTLQNIQLYRQLWEMGLSFPLNHLYERFGIPQPQVNDNLIKK